ncbi:MAG: hypothetical protein RSD67_08480 [Oscillospiraceae bacterium]
MKKFNDTRKIFHDSNKSKLASGKTTEWVDVLNKPLSYPPNTHSHHSTDIIDPLESLVFVEDYNSVSKQFETTTLEVLMTKNKPIISQDAENEKVRVLSERLDVTDKNTAVNNTEILEIIGGKYLTNGSPKVTLAKTASGVVIDTNIKTSDVVGLDKIFNGTTAITDLKIADSTYTVKDFMKFAQRVTPNTIYVSASGSNGTGEYFSPYNSLNTAFTALSTTKTNIIVQDCGDFTCTVPATQNLSFFSADNASISGNITITKPNCVYKVCNHTGNISINAHNVVVVITGTFSGNLLSTPNFKAYVRINKFIAGTSQQPIAALGLEAGSVVGKFTVGLVAL